MYRGVVTYADDIVEVDEQIKTRNDREILVFERNQTTNKQEKKQNNNT